MDSTVVLGFVRFLGSTLLNEVEATHVTPINPSKLHGSKLLHQIKISMRVQQLPTKSEDVTVCAVCQQGFEDIKYVIQSANYSHYYHCKCRNS